MENQSSNGHSEGFGTRVDHLSDGAQQWWADARGAVNDLQQTVDLAGRVQRHPYGTLAAAAGIGYILGGGLFTRLTAVALRLAVRLAAVPLVKNELIGLAQSAVASVANHSSARSAEQNSSSGAV